MESQEEYSFILNVKEQLLRVDLTDEVNIYIHCENIFKDCEQCLTKIFEIITPIADGTDCDVKVIVDYINEITLILEMLQKLINSIVKRHSFKSENVKSVPLILGKIILVIFNHCKASGTIYGVNVEKIEEILKSLFSSCRDLQSFYLKLLCTHFDYNPSISEELEMLVKVLDINLQIADLANDLDVKTMAEQWKAYTLLCEKYSLYLKNTLVFRTTLICIVKLLVNSVKNITKNDVIEKYTLRTLKVTNFLLKILGKLYEIFKDCTDNDYGLVVYMLSYLKVYSFDYLARLDKPADLFKKMDENLSQIVDYLLKLFVNDDRFIHDFIGFDFENLEGDIMLGYVHLLICIIMNISVACSSSTERPYSNNSRNEAILTFIFNLVPRCEVWFNMDFQYYYSSQGHTTLSLFEYLLINTALMVTTCDSKNYSTVEKCMYEAILGVDFWKALFACDLWIILAGYTSTKLVYDQLMVLCDTYKKLNKNKLFGMAPQKVHFDYLLEGLYKALSVDFKIQFSKIFPIDEDNLVLWQAIKIKNIPCEIASKLLIDDFNSLLEQVEKKLLRHADHRHIYELVNIYKTISTCPQLSTDTTQKFDIVKKWDLQILLENKLFIDKGEEETTWFTDYVEALCALTKNIIKQNVVNPGDVKKIFICISAIICKTRSESVKVILLQFLYRLIKNEKLKLSNFTSEISNILYEALKCDNRLLQATVCEILTCLEISNRMIITKLICLVEHTQKNKESLLFMVKNKKLKIDSKLSRKEQLLFISRIKYSHKCLPPQYHSESRGGNFEIDLDCLLEAEEPATKKTKLDISYVDNVIFNLEDNTRLLSELSNHNFNDEHRTRIAAVCEKLKSLCN